MSDPVRDRKREHELDALADPEILADLRLRESSRHDSSRSSEPPVWTKPETVAEWPCRNMACRVLVEVTHDAVEHLAMFNRMLVANGEVAIGEHEVVVCEACRRLLAVRAAEKRDVRCERTTELIRALKQADRPRDEDEILAELRKLHHPDLAGLLESLDSDSGGKSQRRKRASNL